MSRYHATAVALKIFSLNRLTKVVYRKLGNRIGTKRRLRLDDSYLERAAWLRTQLGQLPAGTPLRALELGTGWMHFYAIYLRLFCDIKLTLFDVWDNRQLDALQKYFSQLIPHLTAEDRPKAEPLIQAILAAPDFDTIYELLDIEYIIDHHGSLAALEDNSFDFLFSMDVLEHVVGKALEPSIREYYRVLKPGGLSLHQIGVDDHLAHYDPKASKKKYLEIPTRTWKRFYQNDVQYTNRVSFDRFRELFNAAGFSEIEVTATREPEQLAALNIAEEFRNQSTESLEATRVYLVHRK